MKFQKVWKSAYVIPLLKEGDLTKMDNYRQISKLCILSKVFETLSSEQLSTYLAEHNILKSQNLTGFGKNS